MMKVYNVIISKSNSDCNIIGDYLKSIFLHTWCLIKNKNCEVWYCARENPVVTFDFVASIKHLNKDINGVLVSNVIIDEIGYDYGCFRIESGKDPIKQPGTKEIVDILIGNKK